VGGFNPADVSKFLDKIDLIVKKKAIRTAYAYERIIQRKFREEKSGKPGRSRTRSAPGEAPAIDTGRLSQSVRHEVKKLGVATYEVQVGTDVEYAPALEYGTSTMEPRPAWEPSMKELSNSGEMNDIWKGEE
jgi:hypothetical protein